MGNTPISSNTAVPSPHPARLRDRSGPGRLRSRGTDRVAAPDGHPARDCSLPHAGHLEIPPTHLGSGCPLARGRPPPSSAETNCPPWVCKVTESPARTAPPRGRRRTVNRAHGVARGAVASTVDPLPPAARRKKPSAVCREITSPSSTQPPSASTSVNRPEASVCEPSARTSPPPLPTATTYCPLLAWSLTRVPPTRQGAIRWFATTRRVSLNVRRASAGPLMLGDALSPGTPRGSLGRSGDGEYV